MNPSDQPPHDPDPPGSSRPDFPQYEIPVARPVSTADELSIGRAPMPDSYADSNPMLLNKLTPPTCVVNLLAVFAASLATMYLMGRIISARPGFDIENPEESVTILVMLPVGLVTVAVIIILLYSQKVPLSAIGISGFVSRKFGGNLLLGLAAAAAAFGVFFLSSFAMSYVWPEGVEQLNENAEHIDRIVPKLHPLTLLVVMCFVAIYEEIIFRGLLLTHLRRIFSSWTAATIVAGGIFGLVHITAQVWAAAIPLCLVGITWSLFTIWRRSLLPAIIGHLVFNFTQVMVLLSLEAQEGPAPIKAASAAWSAGVNRALASFCDLC